MQEFIDKLTISFEDKIKLNSIGADNPAALLGVIYAAPEAMEQFIGKNVMDTVTKQLEAVLTPEQKAIFSEAPPDFKIQPFLDSKN